MTTLNLQVAASADDCFVYVGGDPDSISLTQTEQLFGYVRGGGQRFLNVTIPNGATITAAYLTYTASDNWALTTVNIKVSGEDADNCDTYSTLANYQGRTLTTANVAWTGVAAWTAETEYNTPSLSAIVQEIVNRAGWTSGNAMAFQFNDTLNPGSDSGPAVRRGYAWNGSTTKCVKFHVEYSLPSPRRNAMMF